MSITNIACVNGILVGKQVKTGTGKNGEYVSVELTLRNAKFAGVDKYVKATVADVKDFSAPNERCLVLANPPYGERLLDVKAAEELYKVMGEKFVQTDGQKYFIISPHDEFEKFFGRESDKRRKLYNGMIKCQLFMYFKKGKGI